MTQPAMGVLELLLTDPQKKYYGLEISHAVGFPSGTIHPILARLETIGWLESEWEEIDPRAAKRPRRRYYSLSKRGVQMAAAALDRAKARRARTGLRPILPAPGV